MNYHKKIDMYKISTDRSTAVSLTETWLPMDTAPMQVKVQALTIGKVGIYTTLSPQTVSHFLGWAPVPAMPDWLR
jgi:hypothetical protein